MNPILAEMHSTVLPSAPFVIAAFALVWVALFVYVIFVVRGLKKTEAQLALLEDALREKRHEGGVEQEI